MTDAQLHQSMPQLPSTALGLYQPLLVASMIEFAITTRERVCAYIAQVGHESLDLHYMQEIASGQEYEGRRDLGNFNPGDGVRFKGRGPIQTTGRFNYSRAAIALNLPLVEHPELLEEPVNGFRASAFFWKTNGCNGLADALNGIGNQNDLLRFDKITLRVNGGLNGAQDRRARYVRALKVFGEDFTLP